MSSLHCKIRYKDVANELTQAELKIITFIESYFTVHVKIRFTLNGNNLHTPTIQKNNERQQTHA